MHACRDEHDLMMAAVLTGQQYIPSLHACSLMAEEEEEEDAAVII